MSDPVRGSGGGRAGAPASARSWSTTSEPLVRIVASYLEREGFEVADGRGRRARGRAGRARAARRDRARPDAPRHRRHRGLPADPRVQRRLHLMLTARAEEVDKIVGPRDRRRRLPDQAVLARRARRPRPRDAAPAARRRRPPATARALRRARGRPAAREARVDGRPVELTRIEFDLLDALSAEPRVAFSREQLLERVWGPDWFGDDHVVDVHIAQPAPQARRRPAPRRATCAPCAASATAWATAEPVRRLRHSLVGKLARARSSP